MGAVPTFGSVVLDCADPERVAGFYAELLDWPKATGRADWLTLNGPGGAQIEFQRAPDHQRPTWPTGERPQQLHLDLRVTDLPAAHDRALALGAELLDDQGMKSTGFRVYADPAGHPFCLCAC
ncbi:VOC family protein [Amycolatopsis suaedae]|uniref:VOC family protein n=1 Tax=Amycolatopsis suaedae TaxID=2510978 RepID=A0A4Q7J997_9PSEU|nr:VOC family protein [Amycolatopsis suaedae]RZQ64330.1 VOC family protein [Amycolatopsis suaedae]